jgi:hypothetical protein
MWRHSPPPVFCFVFLFFSHVALSFHLYFKFALYFGLDFHLHFVLWVFFWEGCSGFLVGFWELVGLGCFRGRFGCLMEASSIFWALGVLGASCGFQVLGLILVGLFGFFLSWAGFGCSCVYS